MITLSESVIDKAWPFVAAFAGGLTSMAFQRPLNWVGRLVAVGVGFITAIFLAPAIVEWWLPHAPANSKVVAAIYYLMSTVAMSIIPPFLRWAAAMAGDPLAFFKPHPTPANPEPDLQK